MKKTKIFFLTALALLLCLCGIFLPSFGKEVQVSTEISQASGEDFSLEKARYLLKLCTLCDYPRKLETTLLSSDFGSYKHIEKKQTTSYKSGIAFSVAKSTDEILVIIRGSTGAEWYSNFHIGTGDTHAGFSAATDFALDELDRYLIAEDIDSAQTKITLTGHSRGGAVANLLSQKLLDRHSFKSVTAYTFACPNTTRSTQVKNPLYQSIYNIENPEDFITRVPLEAWGYSKFGVRIFLPDSGDKNYDTLYGEMEEVFEEIAGYPHIAYKNRSADIENFLKNAENIAPTVDDFYEKKVTTPQGSLTLSEYMENASAILGKKYPLPEGLFILASCESKELSPLTSFMLDGLDLMNLKDGLKLEDSAVNSAHTPETYIAWLSVLDREFFLNRISQN